MIHLLGWSVKWSVPIIGVNIGGMVVHVSSKVSIEGYNVLFVPPNHGIKQIVWSNSFQNVANGRRIVPAVQNEIVALLGQDIVRQLAIQVQNAYVFSYYRWNNLY